MVLDADLDEWNDERFAIPSCGSLPLTNSPIGVLYSGATHDYS